MFHQAYQAQASRLNPVPPLPWAFYLARMQRRFLDASGRTPGSATNRHGIP